MTLHDVQAHCSERSRILNGAWATGLAAAMTLMATVASARPISCVGGTDDSRIPDDGVFHCETVSHDYSATTTSNKYEFNFFGATPSVTNTLVFDTVVEDMTVFMSAFFVNPAAPEDFLDRIPDGFLPETFITTFGPTWIYFRVEDLDALNPLGFPPQSGEQYEGDWLQHIVWFGDGSYNDPQVLHDSFSNGSDFFGENITVAGSFDPTPTPCDPDDPYCEPPPTLCAPDDPYCDPAIDGSAGDFTDTIVVDSVPEPASLLLLGGGLGGLLYRRRRT